MKNHSTKISIVMVVLLLALINSLIFASGTEENQTSASKLKPGVVYSGPNKFDKSFNEGIYNGIKQFVSETGVQVKEVEPENTAFGEKTILKMANEGYDPIIAISYNFTKSVEDIAKKYPNTKFVIIDTVAQGDNVQSILFKQEQGAFLVGAIAALTTKTKKVGFIGGMDIPVIRSFYCGYAEGVKYINKNISVIMNMTGSTVEAFANPSKGGELTKAQFEQGVDVVFAAAGGTGLGVYRVAKEEGKFAIGVDSNQNYLHPGTMLTSMLKNVNVAVYKTLMDAKNGTWKAGIISMGIENNGVGWALDEYNKNLISESTKQKLSSIETDIKNGKIQVTDFIATNSCQY